MVRANSTCFGVRLPSTLSASMRDEDQQRVERRAQLVRHVGQELATCSCEVSESCSAFSSSAALRLLDLAVLALDLRASAPTAGAPSPAAARWSARSSSCLDFRSASDFCRLSGLLLQAVVGLLQLLLLRLQLGGQRLRLVQQVFGPHVGRDRVAAPRRCDSVSWSRNVRWISLNCENDASSITAFTSPSNSTGRTTMFSGARRAQRRS